jgi:hypothetical protein
MAGLDLNLWSYLIDGAKSIITWIIYGMFPTHVQMNLVDSITTIVQTTMDMTFILVFSNLNMTLPIIVFGVIAALEVVKVIYSLWRWFKKIVL